MDHGKPNRKSRCFWARLRRVVPFVFLYLFLFGAGWVALNAEMGTSNFNLSAADREFLQKAAQASMADVAFGQLAEDQSDSPQVKSLGRRMALDHGAILSDLVFLAKRKGVELPVVLDERHQAKLDSLKTLSGPAFDRAYLDCLTRLHGKDVVEYGRMRYSTTDDDVKKTLDQMIPLIRDQSEFLQAMPTFSRN